MNFFYRLFVLDLKSMEKKRTADGDTLKIEVNFKTTASCRFRRRIPPTPKLIADYGFIIDYFAVLLIFLKMRSTSATCETLSVIALEWIFYFFSRV